MFLFVRMNRIRSLKVEHVPFYVRHQTCEIRYLCDLVHSKKIYNLHCIV